MSTHKFRFTHERFSCNVPTKGGNVAVDTDNGFYSTDNDEVAKYLTEKSEKNNIIIPLDKVSEIIAESAPHRGRPKTVAGARSTKETEGEIK